MYNLDIQSVTAQSAKATAYGDLRMRSRAVKVLDTFFRFPIPTVSSFSNEAIPVTITDSAVLDQSGNNIEEQVNAAQVRALRNEMALRRSAAFRFAQPVMIVCGALLLILVIMRGAFGITSPEMVEQLALVQLLAGVCVLALGAAVLFMFGLSGSLSLVAFYGPRLTVTKEKQGDVSRWHFALLSSRVTTAEKEVLQLPEDFRARLEKYIAPAKLIFAIPGASEGEILLYHNANSEAGFSQYNFVSFPLYGAQPVGLMRVNGEVRTLYLDQHPFDPSANWPYHDMRNASEEKYLKAVEAICKAIYQNEALFITTGATNSGQLISAYTETMKRVAAILFFCFASFALSAQNIAAVAALNGAASYVPDMGERVVYMFEKGNLPAIGNGVSTLPELLRDIPGFHDNENRGGINKVVTITKDNRRKDFPTPKAPESARPVVTSVAPVLDDEFVWGDSVENVRRFSYLNRTLKRAIIQATTPGGFAGAMDAVLIPLGALWGLIIGVLYLVVSSLVSETGWTYKNVISFFNKASEGGRFMLWGFLAFGAAFVFVRFWLWTAENWISWGDLAAWAFAAFVLYKTIAFLVHNPSFAKHSGGRDVIPR